MGNKAEYKIVKPKGFQETRLQIKGAVDIFQPPMEREIESLIAKMKAKKGEEQHELIIDCSQLSLKNTDTANLLIYFLEDFINNKLRRHGLFCSHLVADQGLQKLLVDKGIERLIDLRMELP